MANKNAGENGKKTRFNGKTAAIAGRKGATSPVRQSAANMRARAAELAITPLNDVGVNKLKRMGFNVEKGETTVLDGVILGQAGAGLNGNEKAARFYAELLGVTNTQAGNTAADDPLTEAIKGELKDGD